MLGQGSAGQRVLGHEQHHCPLHGLKSKDPQERAKSPFVRCLSRSWAANPSEKGATSHLPNPVLVFCGRLGLNPAKPVEERKIGANMLGRRLPLDLTYAQGKLPSTGQGLTQTLTPFLAAAWASLISCC